MSYATSLCGWSNNTDTSIQYKTDTISHKEIVVYLAKGLEARQLVIVLRKELIKDSIIISYKDSIITEYLVYNQALRTYITLQQYQIQAFVKKYKRERFFRRAEEVAIVILTVALIVK